jgi:colanic acid/amylovoran biosynthesis protein
MTTIYFTGQNNFGNRGCEALVRSTVATLREQNPSLQFLVPSLDIPRDSAQWPEAAQSGVRFIPSPSVPASYKWWGRLCKLLPMMKSLPWPSLKGLNHLEEYLQEADAVISIGGDNYSLDYGLVSLFFFVGVAERAIDLGKKTALWGASVGPFSSDRLVEESMARHLKKLSMVSIRESHSENYIKSIGIEKNLVSVADSAFALERQAIAVDEFWPRETGDGIVGINVSEVIQISIEKHGKHVSAIDETISFTKKLLKNTHYSVLLIPHVAPLDGNTYNNDEFFLEKIHEQLPEFKERLGLVPSKLNCCQLKEIISKCRFFIGGRTHATIASISTLVPTISIAYSIKARGINLDLFSHEDYVLPTPEFNSNNLWTYFKTLESREEEIKNELKEKIPLWKANARKSAITFSSELKTF